MTDSIIDEAVYRTTPATPGLQKTTSISLSELRLSKYLEIIKNIPLSKIMFTVRSTTLNMKELSPWLFQGDTCVALLKQ